MKRFFYFGSYHSYRPFILTVDSGADARFTIPTSGGGYNYSVNTSDGQTFSGVTGNQLIIFPLTNTLYDIEISGLFPRIYIANNSERLKVKNIKQWGNIVWMSFNFAFYGCLNLICTATDFPNVSNVDSFQYAFRDTLVNVNVNSWDWSSAKSLSATFWNSIWDNDGVKLDISVPRLGFNSASNTDFLFYLSPIKEVILRDINYDLNLNATSLSCANMTLLELHGCFSAVDIRLTALTGIGIDNLANSVADLTGFSTKNVTMTLAQRASCNQALWTNKNWTIIAF